MKTLGTSGTRSIAPQDEVRLKDYLVSPEMHLFLSEFDRYVSGACIGWDALFGRTLALAYPGKEHYVIVPADRSRVDYWWHKFDLGRVKVLEMPEGTTYKDRNEAIVGKSDHLFYCADYPEEHGKSQRSGTWQTVRLARGIGTPVHGIILHDE